MKMRRASALLMALWVITILGIIALSFASEAGLQGRLDFFVQERNRANRLIDAAQVLAEIVITGYSSVNDWSEDQENEKLLEDDRWYLEKQNLKMNGSCRIGPIIINDPEEEVDYTVVPPTVTIDISISRKINVNELFDGGDSKYYLRWEMMLINCGIPDDFEIETDDGTFRLIDHLIACWNDWRDENSTVTEFDGKACGAESEWYEEFYEDEKFDDELLEYRRYPRNSSIPDIRELSYIRGFRDYPAVLKGGVLNPDDDPEDQITISKGIVDLLSTTGSAKVYINDYDNQDLLRDLLLALPGIYQEDDDDQEDAQEIVTGILDGFKEKPENYEVDESRTWWPYKDLDDINQRLDKFTSLRVGNEAAQYLVFKPDDTTLFNIQMTCTSKGMERRVSAKAYIKDGKVRYVEWEEDPKEIKDPKQGKHQ